MPEKNDLIKAKNTLSNRLLDETPISRNLLTLSAAAAESPSLNVHAVGVGRKIVNGEVTEQDSVRIYVIQKLPLAALSQKAILPKEIDGIPVDVIESSPAFITMGRKTTEVTSGVGNVTAHAPVCTNNRKMRQRPVVGGISAGHFQITAGTISCFCRSTSPGDDQEDIYVLSNNHVFADVNKGMPGDALLQPGSIDGGSIGPDRFADLARFVTITLGGVAANRVDAAIGKVLPGNVTGFEICTVGRIDGLRPATQGLKVCKHGRTSGFTEGVITDESYDAKVGMDHSDPGVIAKFVNQMRIEVTAPHPAFGLGGDSGSLILSADKHEAVGLYFAGPEGGAYGVANHIDDVLSELKISLA